MLRLWQAVEARLSDRPYKVVVVAPCVDAEADPEVAMRFARLAGHALGRNVVLLGRAHDRIQWDGRLVLGPLPGHGGDPRELERPVLHRTWGRLGERADLVVIDSPSVLDSPVGLALAPTADGVILLVEAERTRAKAAAAARDALAAAGATILGIVLNRRRHYVPKALYEFL
jgi:hypothetical protein